MKSVPTCAGQSKQTFLPESGERVFLCLESDTRVFNHQRSA